MTLTTVSRPSSSASTYSRLDRVTTTMAAITPNTNEPISSSRRHHSPSISSSTTQAGESSWTGSSCYPHCSFCLVAEFDIDKGSTLSFQYPAPIGHDDYLLAELMLPDGVHARNEDWTVFFLPAGSEDARSQQTQHQQSQGNNTRLSSDDSRTVSSKGKERSRDDLFHVLNLVRTKHDNTVRRGALVKAIAVGTRHPFIHVFKPALLLALDDYFKSPSMDVLVRLFDSLNSLDLTAMPLFSREEKLILRASERRDLFDERFKDHVSTRSGSGLKHLTNMMDEESNLGDTSRSRSESTSTTQSSAEEVVAKGPSTTSTTGGTGRSTPLLPHRPSIASLRPGSNGSGMILKRRPSAAAQMQLQQSSSGLDGSHISLPNNAMWKRPNGAAVSSMATLGNGRVKDTHYWETSITYGKIQELPIRIPTDCFGEEVGEYSLIDLITTFSSTTPIGPMHPHLHSNGHLTPPLVILFNAITTGKRIVFLGHNQPANRVANHVLSACALGSGCGSVWRGVARRCFPYANLSTMDELEKVPGYIAGVTNPRFEDLHAWDLLLNIENGKMIIAKDMEPAPSVRTNTRPQLAEAFSSASLSSSTGFGPEGEVKIARTPSDTDILSSGAPSFTMASTIKGRGDRAAPVPEAKADAPENLFMEELLHAVAARFGERYIRSRISDWAANFIRQVIRHEEHFYGHSNISTQSQRFSNGQLGSGLVSIDREAETKDVIANALRVEAFRGTDSYRLYRQDEAIRERNRAITGFDLNHQISRLRKARKLPTGECELIFSTVTRATRTLDQFTELLSLLPPQKGGLTPFSSGLFHSSTIVRAATQDLLVRLTLHPVGKKFVQSLNLFHRLALARLLHDTQEVSQTVGPSQIDQTVTTTPTATFSTATPTMNSNGRESLSLTSGPTLSLPRDGLPIHDSSNSSLPHWSRSASPAVNL